MAGVSRDLRARRPVLRHFLSWRPSWPGLQRNDDSRRQLRMTATMERPSVRRSISINQPHSIGAQVTHCACSYSCWCCVISVRHRAIISLLCRSKYDHARKMKPLLFYRQRRGQLYDRFLWTAPRQMRHNLGLDSPKSVKTTNNIPLLESRL